MTKLAKISYDGSKWVATYRGTVVSKSANRNYVEENCTNGWCKKVKEMGITGFEYEAGSTVVAAPKSLEAQSNAVAVQEVERFNINERFSFVTNLVEMVASKSIPSVIITGEGGLGKTFTVIKTLKSAGLTDTRDFINNSPVDGDEEEDGSYMKPGDYTIVKGFSTAKGLYRMLYENRNKIVVFDDIDNILRDPVALMLLKGALDSYDERWISWNAEASANDDLPRCFKFTGQVVFISNLPLMKIDQAIRSRSMCVDLAMTDAQKIERMGHILHEVDFMPEFDVEIKMAALALLSKFLDKAREISLRTLISLVKICARGGNCANLAEYVICN